MKKSLILATLLLAFAILTVCPATTRAQEATQDAGVAVGVREGYGEGEATGITASDAGSASTSSDAADATDNASTCGLIVAGGFGSSLNLRAAARIGLFPHELLARARNVGNAAADGASMILVSDEARETVEELARTCRYLELSTDPRFSEHFIDEMYFPSSPNSSTSPSFP